ncbi:effector-associated constant component EACC1 [Streptomyces sp. ALB3]|uniref:effector-associated constant component EACC1 n=1 Tax=Streptomyces sp. ALB3 TaxID=3374278 RepID=UPI0037A448F6
MRIRIPADGDEEALVDLQAWLADDPGSAQIRVTAVGGHGGPTMNALEAVDVILGNAVDIAAFALAYVTWRSVRRDETPARSADEGSGGHRLVHGNVSVDIGHLSPEELAGLLRRLEDTPAAGADE